LNYFIEISSNQIDEVSNSATQCHVIVSTRTLHIYII